MSLLGLGPFGNFLRLGRLIFTGVWIVAVVHIDFFKVMHCITMVYCRSLGVIETCGGIQIRVGLVRRKVIDPGSLTVWSLRMRIIGSVIRNFRKKFVVVAAVQAFSLIAREQLIEIEEWLDEFNRYYFFYVSCWFHFYSNTWNVILSRDF